MNFIHKNTNRFLLIVRILFLLFSDAIISQETGFIKIKNYTPQEYKAYPQNWGIAQRENGILYFANTVGIIEFDGKSWRNIKLTNNSSAISIAASIDGRIYAGGSSEFGYLESDKSGKMKFVSLVSKIKNQKFFFSDVWQTQCVGKQAFFLAQKHLFRFDGKESVTVFASSSSFTNSFHFNNRFFVVDFSEGLKEVIGNKLVKVEWGSVFLNNPGWVIIPVSNEKFLYGSFNDGLFIVDIITEKVEPFNIEDERFLKERTINCGIRLNDGSFAFGVSDGGVLVVGKNGKTIRKIDVNSGLDNEVIWALFQDKEASLWIATNSGISKATVNSDIEFWNNTFGGVSSIIDVLRFNGKIYLASFSGIFVLKNNRFEKYKDFNRECFSLIDFKTPDEPTYNPLIGGGNSSFIYEIKENGIIPLVRIPENVRDLHHSKINPNRVYAISFDSLFTVLRKDKKWIYEGKIEGISELIVSIAEDKNGDVWLGTEVNGAIRLITTDNPLKPKVKRYSIKDGLPTNNSLMFFFEKEHIIVGTDSGLYKLDSKKERFIKDETFGKEFCNGSSAVSYVFKDSSSRVWISGYRNDLEFISVLIPDGKGKYSKFEEPFLSIAGVAPECFYAAKDGISWFGSTSGLYKYKGNFTNTYLPFNTLIRKVKIVHSDSTFVPTNSIISTNRKNDVLKLDYSQNTIEINYTATTFIDESTTEFKTFMEGLEDNWTEWNKDSKREFINLPEGNYRFHIKARNIYHQESKDVVFDFYISPPWYRTILAYIIYIILIVLLINLIISLNVKRIKAANIKLQKLVDERTAEISKQNIRLETQKAEISKQKDSIEQQANNLKKMNNKLVELDKFKEGLTGMIVHDLKNPLNTILGLSKEPETVQAGKQMLNMVLNILDVQKFENVQMTLNQTDCRLSEVFREAVDQVRFLLERKSISFKNNTITEFVVKVDFDLIVRVVVNLLTNAIKYSPDNSIISYSAENKDGFVTVSIKDSGEGIPEDKIDSIFEKFTQLQERKSGRIRSTGIGLTFCKLAVEAHKGKIWARSKMGEGSVFSLTLPLAAVLYSDLSPDLEINADNNSISSEAAFPAIDKELIIPHILKLKSLSVYEYSDIISIIEDMDGDLGEEFEKWKRKLIITVKSCNEEKYSELLDVFISRDKI